MPVLQNNRQPEPLDWFSGPRGRALLQAEEAVISGALVARPAQQSWLWLAPIPAEDQALQPPPFSLRLHREGAGFAGSVRCSLPLPLPSEGIGNIILQHVLDCPFEGLLEECVRVLEPGGRLWLFALNPWSPYRARWAFSGMDAHGAFGWQQRLGRLGLQPCAAGTSFLGPAWQRGNGVDASTLDRLRAVCLQQVEKRTTALIPPAPVATKWQAGAAPA